MRLDTNEIDKDEMPDGTFSENDLYDNILYTSTFTEVQCAQMTPSNGIIMYEYL